MPGHWATFDCFGTLVDWHTGFRHIFQRIAGDRAAELEHAYHAEEARLEAERFRRYTEITRLATERAAARIGITLSDTDAGALARNWASLPVFADTIPALQSLRDGDWRLGILTNCDLEMFEKTTRTLEVPLDAVITAEEVRSYKPGLAHFTTFRERVKPDTWVHVACSWFHDIAPARHLDVARVWIDRDRTGDDPAAATVVQPTLAGLLPAVEQAARRHRENGGNR
jgi:2-haloacid dehalogenase